MSNTLGRRMYEFARCTRHNLLHLRRFSVSHRNGTWRVRGEGTDMAFPYYPYLAFHDIEGYLGDEHFMPRAGMTVIDAGGCFGEFALFASQRVGPTGHVLVLEPDPANVSIARRVFELNGDPSNIEIVPAGIWSTPGKLRFDAGKDARSAVVSDSSSVGGKPTIEIDVQTLDGLVEAFHLQRLDLIKMDVEGAEVEALAGAKRLPPMFRPSYAIASYHVIEGRRTADLMAPLLTELGYASRTGNPRHLTTWAWPLER